MPRRQVTYSSRPNHRARRVHAQGERQFRTYDTSHIRPQRSKAPTIVAAILAIVVVLVLGFGVSAFLKGCVGEPVDGGAVVVQENMQATIPAGSTANDIADALEDAGLVPSAKDFMKRAKALDVDDKFQAGTYSFTAGMTLDDVINALATGDLGGISLTVPEGYTVDQVAELVDEATDGSISTKEFKSAAKASKFEDDFEFVADAYDDSLEGFLFPKTYRIAEGDDAETLIRAMLNQYAAELQSLDMSAVKKLEKADGSSFSKYEVLIIASLIEREAQLDEERPKVASVIYNRLADDMPLQIDATTAYLYGSDFTVDQLHEEGPYNTYDQTGLPAGPICSPGVASLEAAANPEKTEYLYYVTKGDKSGAHNFSKTYEEHQKNVENA